MDSNTYTRLLELPNEQIHAKPFNRTTTAIFRSFTLLQSPYFNGYERSNITVFGWKFLRIYNIVDEFSHYVVLHPSPKNDANSALRVLFDHWIVTFGIPDNFVTDNGNEYINGELQHICRSYNVQFKPRTQYAPWSNGLVENSNRQLNTCLRTAVDSQYDTWSHKVKVFPFAFNSQIRTNMNLSQYETVFGENPKDP